MGEITLVRHGQANSQAKDEDSYDRLSDLGHQQARWLGEWFSEQGEVFDHVLSGSLRRHKETAAGIGVRPEIDPRLNELDYFNLSHALEAAQGIPHPDPDGFATHAPLVMEAWHAAKIQGNESFAAFETRIIDVLKEAAKPGVKVLAVTSGGVIGTAIRNLLDLTPTRTAHIMLPIFNSSIHRIHVRENGMFLASYNATPHLDRTDRKEAKTNY